MGGPFLGQLFLPQQIQLNDMSYYRLLSVTQYDEYKQIPLESRFFLFVFLQVNNGGVFSHTSKIFPLEKEKKRLIFFFFVYVSVMETKISAEILRTLQTHS